jgi:HEAT repeat protein
MPLIRKDVPPPPNSPSSKTVDLIAALTSESAEARWTAARGLAGTSDSVPALADALLTEADPRVREAILTSLARAGTTESADAVLPHLRSHDAEVRSGALDALRTMPQAARPRLAALLEDRDEDVRLLACEIVRELGGKDAISLLVALLERDAAANVCAAAVEVVAEIGDASVLPALAHCARRFSHEAFLVFAIKVASDRIGGPFEDRRG